MLITLATKLAVINESECIGCTKCIQVCPFDAIIGAPQQMHTILAQECTGCELCVEPCPVDCISMIEIGAPLFTMERAKQRRRAQRHRLKPHESIEAPKDSMQAKQLILDALARTKHKKSRE